MHYILLQLVANLLILGGLLVGSSKALSIPGDTVTATSNAIDDTKMTGDTLYIISETEESWSDFSELLPGSNATILNFSHPPVVRMNDKWQWDCFLCQKMPELVREVRQIRGKKVSIYTTEWEIKPEFFWQNGNPVTGYDVQRTLRMLRRRAPSLNEMIRGVVVDSQNPRKFHVEFREDLGSYKQLMSIRLMPQKLHSKTELPESYGIWRLTAWQKNKATLVLNQYYQGPKPKYHRIEVSNQSPANMPPPADLIVDAKKPHQSPTIKTPDLVTDFYTNTNLDIAILNLRNPKFADKRLRQALSLAIDREAFVNSYYQNYGVAASSFPHPSDPTCPVVFPETKDTDTAAILLRRAGYRYAKDGQLESPDGEPFAIKITYEDDGHNRAIYDALKAAWTSIGIMVSGEKVSHDRYQEKVLPEAYFEDALIATWQVVPGQVPWGVFSSKRIPSKANRFHGNNISGWVNREVDNLLKDSATENSVGQHREICRDLVKHFDEDRPILPLAFGYSVLHYSKSMKPIRPIRHVYDFSMFYDKWMF